MRGGYHGRYLRVELETGTFCSVPLSEAFLDDFVGGVGLGTALLLNETRGSYDPLGAAACMVFAFGPLVGTALTTTAKFAVVAKSPLTERLTDALSSSDFALSGKAAGIDAIVLLGRAAAPSIVLIDGDGVRVISSPQLWGKDHTIPETQERLAKQHPGYHFSVIGVAGENLVRYASLSNDGRHAGRGGLGAVLGAMRVKAVGVRGNQITPIADPKALRRLAAMLATRALGPETEKYRKLGTVANLSAFNGLAALPTRNFQSGQFLSTPFAERSTEVGTVGGIDAIAGEQLHTSRGAGRRSCRHCNIGCEHFFSTQKGSRVRLEYQSLFAFGPLCGVDDPEAMLEAASRCDAYGLDTVSTGGTIAFAFECAERDLWTGTAWAPETKELRFGSGDTVLYLIEAIARQNTSLGRLLALGTRRVAETLGPPAPDFAAHVKGLEMPGYEPRALQTLALGLAVNARGADHNRSSAYEVDFSNKTNRLAPGLEAARHVIECEDKAALIDSLVLCKFVRKVFDQFYDECASMLTTVVGNVHGHSFEKNRSGDDLKNAATRIVLAKKIFNMRQGWHRSEDDLPVRFFEETLPSGVAEGCKIDRESFREQIASYYDARGWNPDGTVPVALQRKFYAVLRGGGV